MFPISRLAVDGWRREFFYPYPFLGKHILKFRKFSNDSFFVPDDSGFIDVFRTDFKLRFIEEDYLCRWVRQCKYRIYKFGKAYERNISDDTCVWFIGSEIADIGIFETHYPNVRTDRGVELKRPNIDRLHRPSSSHKENLGKSPGGSSDIQTIHSGHIQTYIRKETVEFDRASGDKFRSFVLDNSYYIIGTNRVIRFYNNGIICKNQSLFDKKLGTISRVSMRFWDVFIETQSDGR